MGNALHRLKVAKAFLKSKAELTSKELKLHTKVLRYILTVLLM